MDAQRAAESWMERILRRLGEFQLTLRYLDVVVASARLFGVLQSYTDPYH
jgi:hypothetical protein